MQIIRAYRSHFTISTESRLRSRANMVGKSSIWILLATCLLGIELFVRFARMIGICSGDFTSLDSFPLLDTLVLDDNGLSWRLTLPSLPALRTLSMNKNCVDNLPAFLDRIIKAAPDLHYLSLLQNPCCPNFLTGGTPKEYEDYRFVCCCWRFCS